MISCQQRSSLGFYEGIGFVEDEDSGEMILSSQDARAFLEDMKARGLS